MVRTVPLHALRCGIGSSLAVFSRNLDRTPHHELAISILNWKENMRMEVMSFPLTGIARRPCRASSAG